MSLGIGAREITVANDGDDFEKETWSDMGPYFSGYEIFWRTHVVPLRCQNSIHLRLGVDAQLETLAISHYSVYVSLARALRRIEAKADDFKFSEEIFANLQRAAELALKVVDSFSTLCEECVYVRPSVDRAPIEGAIDKIKKYRNRLHDPLLGTLKDENGGRLIPKRESLEKYARWTEVMYQREESDFILAEVQLRQDFNMLCSILQTAWKEMQNASGALVTNTKYRERLALGEEPVAASSFGVQQTASGTIYSSATVLSSNLGSIGKRNR